MLGLAAPASTSTDRCPADFPDMDRIQDGIFTWEQFQACYPELSRNAFDGADTENDGRVTREEWTRFENRPR